LLRSGGSGLVTHIKENVILGQALVEVLIDEFLLVDLRLSLFGSEYFVNFSDIPIGRWGLLLLADDLLGGGIDSF
jgi:hypothetical protein